MPLAKYLNDLVDRSGSSACQKLATFLIEQQKPDFNAQGHLFVEAADEFQKALNWAERAKQKP
ncbi:MAG TPA: hypothetical protein VKX17_06380 [Planctomycetota bacterium]|nr:hypothetical protein [Planctomycetota bacterium]